MGSDSRNRILSLSREGSLREREKPVQSAEPSLCIAVRVPPPPPAPPFKCQRGTEEVVNAPDASSAHGTTDKDTASLLNQPVNVYINEKMCQ